MRHRSLPLLTGAVLTAVALGAVPARAAVGPTAQPASTFIVTTSSAASTSSAVAEATDGLGGQVGHVYGRALDGFSVTLPASSGERLGELPGVLGVEVDRMVSLTDTQPEPPSYGIDRVDQRQLPLSDSFTSGATGEGVTAYIIDTGIRTGHDDFDGRAESGFDAVDDSEEDCNGHGTHVAGTAGGSDYGVAKDVDLVSVRVLDCAGSGPVSSVIAGVDWVTEDHEAGEPAVANMSLGGGSSVALEQAVQRSIDDGVTYAVAAGNDGGPVNDTLGQSNACNGSPSKVPDAITVGATDADDTRAPYSNIGPCVDLFAPGSEIVSAGSSSDSATETLSGTSMATPHVAGVAALYLEEEPDASPVTVAAALVAGATPDVVTAPGSGSPNLLLFSDY